MQASRYFWTSCYMLLHLYAAVYLGHTTILNGSKEQSKHIKRLLFLRKTQKDAIRHPGGPLVCSEALYLFLDAKLDCESSPRDKAQGGR